MSQVQPCNKGLASLVHVAVPDCRRTLRAGLYFPSLSIINFPRTHVATHMQSPHLVLKVPDHGSSSSHPSADDISRLIFVDGQKVTGPSETELLQGDWTSCPTAYGFAPLG